MFPPRHILDYMPRPNLAIIVPTRGRPENVARQIKAVSDTAVKLNNIHVFYEIDVSDPEHQGYIELRGLTMGEKRAWFHVNEGHPTMIEKMNRVVQRLWDHYDYVAFLGDDHVPVTPGWDLNVVAALERQPIVYANDLFQGENIPTAVFMRSVVPRTLGWMAPPEMIHLFCDVYWKGLGERIGMEYLPDTIIEHMHPVADKSDWDSQYRRVNSEAVWKHDEDVWGLYKRGKLDANVNHIKAAMMKGRISE